MKVSATFTCQLLSNHATKMTKFPIEINGNLHFLKFGMVKLLQTLHNVADVKNLLLQVKIVELFNIFLFLIYIFDQIISVILSPKKVHDPLTRMYYH